MIAIGSLLVLKNSINLGNLTVLISLSGIVVSSLNQFGSFQAQYESMQVASHRLESILINMENENVCGEIILDKKIESIRCKRVSIKKEILYYSILLTVKSIEGKIFQYEVKMVQVNLH